MRIALVQQHASGSREDNLARGLAAARKAATEGAELVLFAELAFTRFFPQYLDGERLDVPGFFADVARRTAFLISEWMRVGFVHGVMNTDNMSVLGLTIDYGPYGFLDAFDPVWTPNTTDAAGRRYRYEHQPSVALWNLSCLANALLPLIEEVPPLEAALTACAESLSTQLDRMYCQKLGFVSHAGEALELARSFRAQLAECELDMTNSYRALIEVPQAEDDIARLAQALAPASYAQLTAAQLEGLGRWLQSYQRVRAEEGIDPARRREQMQLVNPKFILRNYMAQLAIESAEGGDLSVLRELHQLIRAPYAEQPGMERWTAKRPDWAAHKPGCSMLSCSS